MKDETKMHMPEGIDAPELVEKKVPTRLIALVILLLAVGVFAILFFLGDTVSHNPLARIAWNHDSTEEYGTGSPVTLTEEQIAQEKAANEEKARAAAIVHETLIGIPILVTDTAEKKFIRLSVKDKGIVSVGVDENTKNSADGSVLKLSDIKPGKELAVEAVLLADTEMYDYRAETVLLPKEEALSIEERAKRISENAVNMLGTN